MNLIDQLGGYEKAKSIYKNRPQTSTHYFNGKYYENCSIGKWVRFDVDQCVDCKKPDSGSVNLGILGLMLLEYRRQHNIFEHGDYIVWSFDYEPSHLYTVKNITEKGYDYGNDWGWYGVLSNEGVGYNFRHATNEEIKAGKRLEVTK